jgi:hypothetical protein
MKTYTLVLAACLIAVGATGKTASGFAVVDSSGTLVRGNALGVSHAGDGFYIIDFDHSVKKCVFTASTGSATTGTPAPGIATVVGSGNDPDGVIVTTYNTLGAAADYSFHLNVRC